MNKLVLVFITILTQTSLFAQTNCYYLLELNSKDTTHFHITNPQDYLSAKSIQRRAKFNIDIDYRDLPVTIQSVESQIPKGFNILGKSKWLNAIVIVGTEKINVKKFPLGKEIKKISYLGQAQTENKDHFTNINELISALEAKVDPTISNKLDSSFYGKMLKQNSQINAPALHKKNLTGKGITVAVLDAGFNQLNANAYFNRLFVNNQILLTRDFVTPNTGVYEDDVHGSCVLSCMAAYSPNKGVGTGFDASFVLLRTEDQGNELLLEEVLWVMGAEFADSIGIDLLQSSLGYNEFDDVSLNHRMKELNGNTTIISRGAKIATEKGIIVVNSSGNEGDNDWRRIVAPADVKEVITVGGIDQKGFPALFSSVGPTADNRIKPDVAALAENDYVVSGNGVIYTGSGTSYACPIIAGAVTCLMQACPNKNAKQLADALRLCASNYYEPDKYIGYGVPDMLLALKILGGDSDYKFTTNKLLDVRWLADNKLHITNYLHTAQKFTIVIRDTSGVELYKEQVKMKEAGVYRFSIKRTKKWDNGVYHLQMIYKEGKEEQLIIK